MVLTEFVNMDTFFLDRLNNFVEWVDFSTTSVVK